MSFVKRGEGFGVKSSGTSIHGEHAPRGGNRQLKRAMFLSAFAALHDPVSRTYYDRCRTRGKTHTQALRRLARHRISVLFAMLRDDTFYAAVLTATPGIEARTGERGCASSTPSCWSPSATAPASPAPPTSPPTPASPQRRHPRVAVGLDPDHHLARIQALTTVAGHEFVQPGNALHTFGQFRRGKLAAGLVLQLDTVVVLGSVITDQQQHTLPNYVPHTVVQPAEGTARGLMDPVLTPRRTGTPPHQRSGRRSPTTVGRA